LMVTDIAYKCCSWVKIQFLLWSVKDRVV